MLLTMRGVVRVFVPAADDDDAASAAQSIDDQLAVDKGIVESLNVE